MVDKARRIFGRKAVAKRGRFGHQIVVVFLPERLQVQYLADVSAPRGGKADAGAAFSCGHRDRKSTRLNPVTNAHLVCRLLLEKKKKPIPDTLNYIYSNAETNKTIHIR